MSTGEAVRGGAKSTGFESIRAGLASWLRLLDERSWTSECTSRPLIYMHQHQPPRAAVGSKEVTQGNP